MLLTTPKSVRWRRWSLTALVIMIASYVLYANHGYPHGGTFMGIIYGVIGLIVILILMYYGARKRAYTSSTGTVEGWLHAHIYLGVLVFFIILFHSGFRFHDKLAVTALALLTIVVLSGIVGALLYTMIPPLMINVESNLTGRELSNQVNQLAEAMARLSEGKSRPFQEFCAELLPKKPEPFAGWRMIFPNYYSSMRSRETRTLAPENLARIPANEQSDLQELLVLENQLRGLHNRMIQRQRYINTMAAWLYLHVPLSFAMLAAILAHVVAVFYYW